MSKARIRRMRLALASLWCGLAVACASVDGDERAQPPEPAWQRVASNGGAFVVEYSTRPAPIPLNAPFEVDVRVFGPDGALATDVDVVVDAWMPAHRHGMNRASRVERQPDGTFVARGMLLHMAGLWNLTIDVSRGGSTDRAQLDLTF